MGFENDNKSLLGHNVKGRNLKVGDYCFFEHNPDIKNGALVFGKVVEKLATDLIVKILGKSTKKQLSPDHVFGYSNPGYVLNEIPVKPNE